MTAGILLRDDFDGSALRRLARQSHNAGQTRRLLALAEIYGGGSRSDAARIGGVGVQIVRDWVVRFNAKGPDGLLNGKAPGAPSILDDSQRQVLRQVVEDGPLPAIHGVVRWRLIDLARWLFEEFRLEISKQTLSRELRNMGFRKLSARPRHHAQDEEAAAAFKNVWPAPSASDFVEYAFVQSASTYPASGSCPRPRWRSARPGPHKTLGVERHFLNQGSSTPFDCQAISLPPLANIVSPSTHQSRCQADSYADMGVSLAAKCCPCRRTAHEMRASLLASATTATFG